MTNRAADALMLDQIEDHDELLTLLLSHFENVQIDVAARELVVRRPAAPWSITLLANKRGHLKEGHGPTSCPDEELAAIHFMVADTPSLASRA